MESNETPAAIVDVRSVTFKGKTNPQAMLVDVSFGLAPGEMLMWHLDRSQTTRDIASLILGLQLPMRGEVLIESESWLGTDYDRHFQMRSRIGRVFGDQAWIANLNLIENVRLSAEHHGQSRAIIDDDVRRWCDHFSVPTVSRERPAFVDAARLQVYQWVRALVSRPRLLLLERPMQSVASLWLPKLLAAINEVRTAGTAVLWFTANAADAAADLGDHVSHGRLERGELRRSTQINDITGGGNR